jgi:hypothetical protein
LKLTGLAGLLAATLHPGCAALAVAGIADQALAAVTLTREGTDQSQRNAERYDRTRTALERLARRQWHEHLRSAHVALPRLEEQLARHGGEHVAERNPARRPRQSRARPPPLSRPGAAPRTRAARS